MHQRASKHADQQQVAHNTSVWQTLPFWQLLDVHIVPHTPKLLLQDMMCDAAGRVCVNLHRQRQPSKAQQLCLIVGPVLAHQVLCCYSSSSYSINQFNQLHVFLARRGNQRGGPLSNHQWWVPKQPAQRLSSSYCLSTCVPRATVSHTARYDLLCCKTSLCCQYCSAECDECACLCASCEKQQPSVPDS
jgi:hypothetical protein